MAGMLEVIRRAYGGMHYRPVRAPLPVDLLVTCPGRFSFGMPWPWEEMPTDGALQKASGEKALISALAHVVAPRTDGALVAILIWSEPNQGDIETEFSRFGPEVAQLYRGTPRRTRRVLLDGNRAAVAELTTPTECIWRLVAGGMGERLQGEFRCPVTQIEAYRCHFDTALGSWLWS